MTRPMMRPTPSQPPRGKPLMTRLSLRDHAPWSGGNFAYIRAAVLTPRGGGFRGGGGAGGAGLGGGRPAKPLLAGGGNNIFVGKNYKKIDDRHKNNEVDDGRNERSQVEIGAIATIANQLPAQSGALYASLRRGDQRVDDAVGERLDQIAERQGYGQADSDDDDIAAH